MVHWFFACGRCSTVTFLAFTQNLKPLVCAHTGRHAFPAFEPLRGRVAYSSARRGGNSQGSTRRTGVETLVDHAEASAGARGGSESPPAATPSTHLQRSYVGVATCSASRASNTVSSTLERCFQKTTTRAHSRLELRCAVACVLLCVHQHAIINTIARAHSIIFKTTSISTPTPTARGSVDDFSAIRRAAHSAALRFA